MTHRILKFSVPLRQESELNIPDGAKFLHAAVPSNEDIAYMWVWFEVPAPYDWEYDNNKGYLKLPRTFHVYGTGWPQKHNREEMAHFATVVYPGDFVWHLYGEKRLKL